MAQKISTNMRFPMDCAQAYAMVTDESYARARADRTAGSQVQIEVSGDPATVISRRVLPVPDELPSFAKSMVGDGIRVEETHTWKPAEPDGSRSADLTVLFPSLPVRVVGTMSLEPDGDGCIVRIEADVTASMPMVGGVIEQGVKGQVLRATEQEQLLGMEWASRT
jgi:hypothetical protein